MSETFDTDAILKDVLEVLHKHGLPVQTLALNLSLLDNDFDAAIPQYVNKFGNFHRPHLIDGVPMVFEAKRHISFDDIKRQMEAEIAPVTEQCAQEIERLFPQFTTTFEAKLHQNRAVLPHDDLYAITITTRLSDAEHMDYNVLLLSIYLRLFDLTTTPQIQAQVGWLVDEESGSDWGLEIVHQQFHAQRDARQNTYETLKRGLPAVFESFRRALVTAETPK